MCFRSERYGFASGSIYIYIYAISHMVPVCVGLAPETRSCLLK